jgi:hypothetical protein
VDKRLDSTTELALCGGILVAILWGIGVSLRGLVLGPQEITWAGWMIQLLSGVLVCLIVPPVLVRVAARIEASRRRGLTAS